MTATPLNETQWEELGREIARKMAGAWGAEWRSHCWEEAEEEALYCVAHPQLDALWKSDANADYDLYNLYKNAARDAWQDELAGLLRANRGSRSLDEVWSENCGRQVHLQLTNHDTITGNILDGGTKFVFRISFGGTEAVISLPENAEFALEPAKRPRGKTAELRLVHESCGFRHYLGARDVHCGRGLKLVLPDGSVVDGRYECALRRDDCVPLFYFTLAGGIDGEQRVIRLPRDADFLMEGRALDQWS